MIRVVGVRFKKVGKVYYFDPGSLDLKPGDWVVVETSRGVEIGETAVRPKEVPDDDVTQPLRKVLRLAADIDRKKQRDNRSRESEAFEVCQARIANHELPMKLVDVEYTFDDSKVVFYFTSEKRVDFRELVKDLAGRFKTRIELRQIGVRDEAKVVGGVGICGRPLCCSTWIADFEPVSIRHAKEQNLSLNPSKISGACGRLKCCLRFEADTYREIKAELPKIGDWVVTSQGKGKVVDVLIVKESVVVRLEESGDRLELTSKQLKALNKEAVGA